MMTTSALIHPPTLTCSLSLACLPSPRWGRENFVVIPLTSPYAGRSERGLSAVALAKAEALRVGG